MPDLDVPGLEMLLMPCGDQVMVILFDGFIYGGWESPIKIKSFCPRTASKRLFDTQAPPSMENCDRSIDQDSTHSGYIL